MSFQFTLLMIMIFSFNFIESDLIQTKCNYFGEDVSIIMGSSPEQWIGLFF